VNQQKNDKVVHGVPVFRPHLAPTERRTSTWAMRDWNVPVRTCRIIEYQQIVSSTLAKISYLGPMHISDEVEDVRKKRKMNTTVQKYEGILMKLTCFLYRGSIFYLFRYTIQESAVTNTDPYRFCCANYH